MDRGDDGRAGTQAGQEMRERLQRLREGARQPIEATQEQRERWRGRSCPETGSSST